LTTVDVRNTNVYSTLTHPPVSTHAKHNRCFLSSNHEITFFQFYTVGRFLPEGGNNQFCHGKNRSGKNSFCRQK